ncbi:unnamed protein product, partial [Didymodactylos carnosus]
MFWNTSPPPMDALDFCAAAEGAQVLWRSSYVAATLSTTLLLMACIDRYLMSSSKMKYRNLATARTATRYVIPTVIAVCCLLYIHMLLFYEIQLGQCQAAIGWYSEFFLYWYLVSYTLLPPTLMTTFGLLTLNNVKKVRQCLAVAP